MSRPPHLPPGIDRWPTGLSTMGESIAINARRFPDKVALSHPLGALTYRELNERSNQLAHRLIERYEDADVRFR